MSSEVESVPLVRAERVYARPPDIPEDPKFRDFILKIHAATLHHPLFVSGKVIPLDHIFAEGTYMRKLYIPKGAVMMGSLHTDSYVNFVESGSMIVVTEDGTKHISGPCSMVSPGQTKRFGYALEDTVWVTVHPNPTNSTDVRQLEADMHPATYTGYALPEDLPLTDITMAALDNLLLTLETAKPPFNKQAFRALTLKVFTKEKIGFFSDWTPEQKRLYLSGDWAAFSQSRGYLEEDIVEVQDWISMYQQALQEGINPFDLIQDLACKNLLYTLAHDNNNEIEQSAHLTGIEQTTEGIKCHQQ